jgi:EF hand
MRKHLLVLTTATVIVICGTIAASAQAPGAVTPESQQSPTIQPTPGGSTTQGQDSYHGMMGPGMMGHGMMGSATMGGEGYAHHGWDQGRGMMGPTMMRIIFSLMDADGDGKLTLQEFQAAHERIFKAMDTDHDGTVSFEEMQAFIRGH